MKISSKTPQESLDKQLLRFRPREADFELFRVGLTELLSKIDEAAREDNQEIHVQNFLRDSFYKGKNEVNKKDRIDLAIHLTADKSSPVGVIIESKRPGNRSEMLSVANPNTKALHELVLYFMRERIDEKNDDLKYLIATNINEWFIFSAQDFEKLFYENTKFRREYEAWRDKLKVSTNTDHFYNEIVKPFIAGSEAELNCTHFDLRDWATSGALEGQSKKLIALYKLLSPHHLLRTKFQDDSNTLNSRFYAELLHIIGLEEYKEKSKTLIRKKTTDNSGSLMEMAVTKLESKDVLPRVDDPSQYGETREQRYEAIALELCITWINRILFLKLLEAQLVGYHEGDRAYRFLNLAMVRDFDDLYTLFHEVLAKTADERKSAVKAKFARVPYLNSSLFEPTDLENQTMTIESLMNHEELPLISTSILKKLGEKAPSLRSLEYLFRFLDAYDFASEGKEEIQSENRSLINASVLGKVFEKINGYKDGSIYTPGFITMYMCRQAIRLAVVQKFKDETDFDGADFDELTNWVKSRNYQKENVRRFNEIIDSLKTCDPAVGSGHFLVSALNEILSIKSELGIFADDQAKTFGDYSVAIANDELIITDRENNLFEYKIRNGKPLTDEMQRLQSTLFHEKQRLIENCLFGVDINPNSVKICRLRLWIELLKNAYYKPDTAGSVPPAVAGGASKNSPPYEGGVAAASADGVVLSAAAMNDQPRAAQTPSTENHPVGEAPTPLLRKEGSPEYADLETLPNIDINIKEGNSLISRFALDADLADVLKQVNFNIDEYRALVTGYKETRDRDAKRGFESRIKRIKEDFKTQLFHFSPERVKRRELRGSLDKLKNQPRMFEESDEINKKEAAAIAKLETDLAVADSRIKAVEENKIYERAFEWRFEFPEVLDDDGSFLGFDVVIGNPPYIRHEGIGHLKEYLKQNYSVYAGTADILVFFYELGIRILKEHGSFSFITSNKFIKANYGANLRHFLLGFQLRELLDFGELPVFDEAATFPIIVNVAKSSPKIGVLFTQVKTLRFENLSDVVSSSSSMLGTNAFDGQNWTLADSKSVELVNKMKKQGVHLVDYLVGEIRYGLKTGLNEAFVISDVKRAEFIAQDQKYAEIIKPFGVGDEIRKWMPDNIKSWLIYLPWHFPLHESGLEGASRSAEEEFKSQYPAIYSHLENFKPKLLARNLAETGIRYEWYALQRFGSTYWKDFEKAKIVYPVIAKEPRFALSESSLYVNDKCFFIEGRDLYLLGYLNSKLAWFYLKNTCSVLGDPEKGGRLELRSIYLQTLPIKRLSNEQQTPFITLVDQILDLKKSGGDTSELERQIDEMVYELYELTPDEIAIVEGN